MDRAFALDAACCAGCLCVVATRYSPPSYHFLLTSLSQRLEERIRTHLDSMAERARRNERLTSGGDQAWDFKATAVSALCQLRNIFHKAGYVLFIIYYLWVRRGRLSGA